MSKRTLSVTHPFMSSCASEYGSVLHATVGLLEPVTPDVELKAFVIALSDASSTLRSHW